MMLPIPRAGTLREVNGRAEAIAVPGIEGLVITIPPDRRSGATVWCLLTGAA